MFSLQFCNQFLSEKRTENPLLEKKFFSQEKEKIGIQCTYNFTISQNQNSNM